MALSRLYAVQLLAGLCQDFMAAAAWLEAGGAGLSHEQQEVRRAGRGSSMRCAARRCASRFICFCSTCSCVLQPYLELSMGQVHTCQLRQGVCVTALSSSSTEL
jgi:hypothetical protein